MVPKKSLIKIGCLLSEKDLDHLSINFGNDGTLIENNFQFILLTKDRIKSDFDLLIHKCSDFIKPSKDGDEFSLEMMNFFSKSTIPMLDPPETVFILADRSRMFSLLDKCTFNLKNISVNVPKWKTLDSKKTLQDFRRVNIVYPIICKALCAGEGPGSHSMQLLFNPNQLDNLKVFPCVAQEFKNHDGVLAKIFVYGNEYFIFTRPSVRNFPVNGQPINKIDSISFDSHEVAKLESKTFLNNYQNNFIVKSSLHGDKILDDDVVIELLRRLSKFVTFNLLGIDILVTNDGKKYELVDVNYLPSFTGVDDKFKKLINILDQYFTNGSFVNYWK